MNERSREDGRSHISSHAVYERLAKLVTLNYQRIANELLVDFTLILKVTYLNYTC